MLREIDKMLLPGWDTALPHLCVGQPAGSGGTSGGTEDGDGKGKERALPLPCTCADYCRLIATPVVH